jgi:hypothetical protein
MLRPEITREKNNRLISLCLCNTIKYIKYIKHLSNVKQPTKFCCLEGCYDLLFFCVCSAGSTLLLKFKNSFLVNLKV